MSGIVDVLERNGVEVRPTGKPSEFIVTCPQCSKMKLYVNVDKRLWICYVCAEGGSYRKLFKIFNIDHKQEFSTDFESLRKHAETAIQQRAIAPQTVDEIKHALPPEFKPLVPGMELHYVGQRVFDYLKKRGVTQEQITAWNLGFCSDGEYGGCAVIPITDHAGQVVSFQARRVVGIGKKSMNPMGSGGFLFNSEFARNHAGLVVVEGPFDAIAVHSLLSKVLNTSSVALLRHSISQEQAAFIGRVLCPVFTWVALDPDVDEDQMHKVGGALRANGCADVRIALLPRDPDELSYEELADFLDVAEPARVLRKS